MSPAIASAPLAVIFNLPADDAGLQRFAAGVSDPSSPSYGHYLTMAEVANRFGASKSIRDAVTRYLIAKRVKAKADVTGSFVEATMTVAQAERMFSVPFRRFELSGSTPFVAPTGPPSLPPALRGRVLGVAGLNTQAVLRSLTPATPGVSGGTPTRTGTPAGCSAAVASGGFTPNQTVHAYGADSLTKLGLAGQGMTMVILTFAEDYVESDVNTFRSCFGITGTEPTKVVLPGSPAPFPAIEPDLDIETVSPIAPSLAGLYVVEDPGVLGTNSGATLPIGLSGAVDPANTGGTAPNVVSISYGGYEGFFSRSAIRASERVLKSAAAAGVTVVAAAGDTGSNGGYYQGQQSLSVVYPSSSAWVTAVGGTNLTLGRRNVIQGQAVWNDSYPNFPHDTGAGGGGASSLFGLPLWQKGPGVSGNRRLVPDVSFFADYSPGYANYCSMSSCSGGQGPGWGAFGGTSISAPFFGSSVVLLDQYLLSKGRPTLGAVNALLYQEASGAGRAKLFDDVVLGNNDLFGLGCCTAGPGYDAASGLGSLRLGAWPGALP